MCSSGGCRWQSLLFWVLFSARWSFTCDCIVARLFLCYLVSPGLKPHFQLNWQYEKLMICIFKYWSLNNMTICQKKPKRLSIGIGAHCWWSVSAHGVVAAIGVAAHGIIISIGIVSMGVFSFGLSVTGTLSSGLVTMTLLPLVSSMRLCKPNTHQQWDSVVHQKSRCLRIFFEVLLGIVIFL